jgi:hypothetical protein
MHRTDGRAAGIAGALEALAHPVRLHWNLKRRERQAKLIHRWKPWVRSTGPKTPVGKAKISRNAHKGGTRPLLRELARLLREQQRGRMNWR